MSLRPQKTVPAYECWCAKVLFFSAALIMAGCARTFHRNYSAAISETARNSWRIENHELLERLAPGMTRRQVAGILAPVMSEEPISHYIAEQPFNNWIACSNLSVVSEWKTANENATGWPVLIFAIFSNAAKTNLIDAIVYLEENQIGPLFAGDYDRRLLSINTNDTVLSYINQLANDAPNTFWEPMGSGT